MFEWLEEELRAVKTPGFHLVDGPADPEMEALISAASETIPADYKEFVLRFGGAKLYRERSGFSYGVSVFGSPRHMAADGDCQRFGLGKHAGSVVYVEATPGSGDNAVFEGGAGGQVAESFEEWLKQACEVERGRYSEEEWKAVLDGHGREDIPVLLFESTTAAVAPGSSL
jgi:hypothetical protein